MSSIADKLETKIYVEGYVLDGQTYIKIRNGMCMDDYGEEKTVLYNRIERVCPGFLITSRDFHELPISAFSEIDPIHPLGIYGQTNYKIYITPNSLYDDWLKWIQGKVQSLQTKLNNAMGDVAKQRKG